jgi:hypothetical protein
MSIQLAAIFALGQYSTEALAAMALTILYCNVTGFSIIIGMIHTLKKNFNQS